MKNADFIPRAFLRDVFDQLDDASERFVTIAPLKSLDSLFDVGVVDFVINRILGIATHS